MENKILVTDYYQITMAYANFKLGRQNQIGYFDLFTRSIPDNGGYIIACGLDKIIECVKTFRFSDSDIDFLRKKNDFDEDFLEYLRTFKFTGDIYGVPDGTVVFPHEPLFTVRGNIIEAQMLETKMLLLANHHSLIATKASRIVNSAAGRKVLEFGTRRAHGDTAAVEGAKAAYIGGCHGTACVETEKLYGVPAGGTMAHSFIESFDTEYEAFLAYAKVYGNKSVFLIDTYDTLRSGLPNAIKVAKEFLIPNGYRPGGVRLDSGDLAYLSKEVRKMLDEAGLDDCKIYASNSLDEYVIADLIKQGAKIDVFGVGENLITSKTSPVFGGVYKLVAMLKEGVIDPRIKLSDNIGKMTNPGYKKTYRFYNKETGYALGDVIALYDENIPHDKYKLVDSVDEWKQTSVTNYTVRELQVPIFINGNLVYQEPTIDEKRANTKKELETLYEEYRRLLNPAEYKVDLSERLRNLKKQLIIEHREKIDNGYAIKKEK